MYQGHGIQNQVYTTCNVKRIGVWKKMIMRKYTFDEIKRDIFEWSQKDIFMCMAQQDKIELTQNNTDTLLFDLTFNNCLAQLTVSDAFWAPYQFVSFEAMTLDSEKAQEVGEPELVYFFYDSNEMTIRDVKKINPENIKGEFLCKDVEAQYLVVAKDKFSLRLLSQSFIVQM